ncbi:MAG: CBS domain-containing protein [Desulfurococcales archaeon]|nr:CBS domain-containing protein [Desulfurococcales archaeon]
MSREYKVRDVMLEKPVTVQEDETVNNAVRKMAELNIGAIPVVNEKGKIVGIFSERDLLRRVAAKGLSYNTKIKEVMTRNPVTISPEATVEKAKDVMAKIKARHLPVIDENGHLVGVVSLSDIEFSVY